MTKGLTNPKVTLILVFLSVFSGEEGTNLYKFYFTIN